MNKRKDEVNKTREKYQVALQDINNYNAKYMEEMTNVFEECQRKEAQRLQEFKDILFAAQKCLNVSEDTEWVGIHSMPTFCTVVISWLQTSQDLRGVLPHSK